MSFTPSYTSFIAANTANVDKSLFIAWASALETLLGPIYQSGGNIGIGASPSYKLDVVGTARFQGPTYVMGSNQSALSLKANALGAGFSIGRSMATDNAQNFFIYDEVAAAYRVNIDSSGNVGIGTTVPGAKFVVNATANNIAQFLSNQSVSYVQYSGISSSFLLGVAGVTCLMQGSGSTAMEFQVGGGSPVMGVTMGQLTLNGAMLLGAPVTKTADFALADTENSIICNKAGTTTVTLPAASSWTKRRFRIKTIQAQTVVSASSNIVPQAGGAAGTAILAATAGKWADLDSDGTNWHITASG